MTARVAWLAVAPSACGDVLFATLAERFGLTVAYLHRAAPAAPAATNGKAKAPHPYRELHAGDDLAACIEAARSADAVVMSGWSDWRWFVVMGWLRLARPKAFWIEAPDARRRPGLGGLARGAVVRSVFLRFDEVWTSGPRGAAALLELGCPERKLRDLPLLVDLDRPARVTASERAAAAALRAAHGGGGQAVVFLAAGPLLERKRYCDAIDAVARAGDRAVLWLCGSGPEEEALRRQAARNGAERRVRFFGELSRADRELAYLACDAFVHPAARDAFPAEVLEAMAWGRPVIGCAEAGSVADRVRPTENGFVHRVGDVDRIAVGMRAYLESPTMLARHQAAARHAAEQHPPSLAVERVEALLARGRR